MNDVWIYESPDDGKTVYRRKFGEYDKGRKRIVKKNTKKKVA